MNKLLPLVFCLFFLSACTKNKNIEKPTEPVVPVKPEVPEVYSVQSVRFNVEGDNYERTFIVSKPSMSVINRTSNPTSANLNPSQGFMESSEFKSDKNEVLNIQESDLSKIRIPVYISQNKEITLGEKKWAYHINTSQLPTKQDFKTVIPVPAYHEMNSTVDLKVQEYSTAYTAILIGQKSGKEVVVNGIWKGTSLVDFNVKTTIKKIE